jgi:IclR family pca regulon transcriptional regulator
MDPRERGTDQALGADEGGLKHNCSPDEQLFVTDITLKGLLPAVNKESNCFEHLFTTRTGGARMAELGELRAVRAFARGLAVIRCFSQEARRLTLTDVAKKTDLSRAGARRFLYTLCELGYASTDGKYFWLTPRVLDIGYSYLSSMELWGFAQEYLEKMSAALGESTSISVLEGHDVVYVIRVPTRRILTSSLNVGSRLPAHVISMGRIQLAALSSRDLDRYLTEVKLTRYTPYTVISPDELQQILLKDRERGYSIVNRELELGISGIAVPILDRQGRTIAGMNVSYHPDRAIEPNKIDEFLEALNNTKAKIEDVLRMRG